MSHPIDVWVPCPPSAVPPGVGNPRGPYTTGGSLPTPLYQTEAPLAPPPKKSSRRSPICYLPTKNFTICPHFPSVHCRFCSSTGQSSSEDDKLRPKYLNKITAISGVSYSKKILRICQSASATTSLRHFLSDLR